MKTIVAVLAAFVALASSAPSATVIKEKPNYFKTSEVPDYHEHVEKREAEPEAHSDADPTFFSKTIVVPVYYQPVYSRHFWKREAEPDAKPDFEDDYVVDTDLDLELEAVDLGAGLELEDDLFDLGEELEGGPAFFKREAAEPDTTAYAKLLKIFEDILKVDFRPKISDITYYSKTLNLK